jgi:hypothetical protein
MLSQKQSNSKAVVSGTAWQYNKNRYAQTNGTDWRAQKFIHE